MKTFQITIELDDETADFLQVAADMLNMGSIENAVTAMIIATRARMRERRFVEKTVREMIEPVLDSLRTELRLRLHTPEKP